MKFSVLVHEFLCTEYALTDKQKYFIYMLMIIYFSCVINLMFNRYRKYFCIQGKTSDDFFFLQKSLYMYILSLPWTFKRFLKKSYRDVQYTTEIPMINITSVRAGDCGTGSALSVLLMKCSLCFPLLSFVFVCFGLLLMHYL